LQKIEKLREEMSMKFDDKSNVAGIKIAFRLPNGEKTEHIFSKTAIVKVSHCLLNICNY